MTVVATETGAPQRIDMATPERKLREGIGHRVGKATRDLLSRKAAETDFKRRDLSPSEVALKQFQELRTGIDSDTGNPLKIPKDADGKPKQLISLTDGNPIMIPGDPKTCVAGIYDIVDVGTDGEAQSAYVCYLGSVDADGTVTPISNPDGSLALLEPLYPEYLADLKTAAEADKLKDLFSGEPNAVHKKALLDVFAESRQDPDFIPSEEHSWLATRVERTTATIPSAELDVAPTTQPEPQRNTGYRYVNGQLVYGPDADEPQHEPIPTYSHKERRKWNERVKRVKQGGAPLSPEELQELDDMAPATLRSREFDNNQQAAKAVEDSNLPDKEKRKLIREILKGTGKWTGISIMAIIFAIPLSMIPLASGAMELAGVGGQR